MTSLGLRPMRLLSVLLAGAAISAPLAAHAGAAADTTVGEVIVTAQKREQRLLDVPISVSAVTATDLAKRGVTALEDMQYAVPGLSITEYAPGLERIQLRGVSEQLGAPTVGVYVDEMPVNDRAAGGGLDVRLIDMERVEVLRGPQPTLYGEDSMGGTIRYITASPDLTRYFGHIEGEIGGLDGGSAAGRLDGWANLPLVQDKVGLRLAAGYEDLGGWIDSTATGKKDVNDATIETFRAKLLLRPTDQLSISLMGLHQKASQDYQNFSLADGTTGALIPQPSDDRYDLANLIVSYDLGPATLLSTTGYLHRDDMVGYDLTAYLAPLVGPLFPPGETYGLNQTGQSTKWNEEVRLTSNGSGPFSYSLGGVYTFIKDNSVATDNDSPAPSPFPILASTSITSSSSWAVFGDLGYAFTSRLKLDVGGRYYRDTENNGAQSTSFDTFNPRVDISYKTSEDGLIYANAGKGFRTGGFNIQIPGFTIPETYQPEKLYSYEVGTKQQFLDRRLIVEASVYYTDWKDVQALSPVYFGFPIITNAGTANGWGFDMAVTAKPTPELTLSGTIAYTGVKYRTNSLDRFAGDPLDLVAPWTWSLAADWKHPVTDTTAVFVHADYGHTDRSFAILRNFGNPVNPTDARDVINARVGVDYRQFEAYVFADNLTNDYGILYPSVGTSPEPIRARPRLLGVGLKANF